MRTSNGYNNNSHDYAQQFPTQQEIDLQISKAKRARSAYIQQLMSSAFTATETRLHQASPATS